MYSGRGYCSRVHGCRVPMRAITRTMFIDAGDFVIVICTNTGELMKITFHEDIGYFLRYDIFLHLKHTVHLTVVKQLCTYFIDDLAFVLHLYIFNLFKIHSIISCFNSN